MSQEMVDRIILQLASLAVESVNLGGNEPLFTNGLDPSQTLLPYIIRALRASGMAVGLTTSGISLLWLHRNDHAAFRLLNDVDISLDSPFREEHDANRGAPLFERAIAALDTCMREGTPRTVVMTAMSWNFDDRHLERLVDIAASYGAYVRINPLKPVLVGHMKLMPSPETYWRGFAQLLSRCDTVDLGEPPLAGAARQTSCARCPCGRSSLRIHSITPQGTIQASPCVYLHDYKAPVDILTNSLSNVLASDQFRAFRQRHANPHLVEGCAGCEMLHSCGGGCTARAFLSHLHRTGQRSLTVCDEYCPKRTLGEQEVSIAFRRTGTSLVHSDYLCTWIGAPPSAQGCGGVRER